MRYLFLWVVMEMMALPALCQTVKYKFRVRYEDYSALSNTAFTINGQALRTDGRGVIDLSIPGQLNYAFIESGDQRLYRIKYPADGRAILPKDPFDFVDIFVAKPAAAVLTRNDLRSLAAELRDKQHSAEAAFMKELAAQNRRIYDSLVALFRSNLLDDARLANGRLEFFPLISNTANHYLNEARDLSDAFAALGAALDNRKAYQQFADAVYSYNEIFEFLNANKSTYEQAVYTYWNSKELSLKYSNLIDFALEEIHKPYILDINFSFVERIYNSQQESSRKKRNELEAGISRDITERVAALNRRLTMLGERISAFITLLNNNSKVNN